MDNAGRPLRPGGNPAATALLLILPTAYNEEVTGSSPVGTTTRSGCLRRSEGCSRRVIHRSRHDQDRLVRKWLETSGLWLLLLVVADGCQMVGGSVGAACSRRRRPVQGPPRPAHSGPGAKAARTGQTHQASSAEAT
jgi:hypothetical protein